MTNLALIAVFASSLGFVIVATGILVLSFGRVLKSFADKGVGTIASTPFPEPAPAQFKLRNSEAKMPSLATLYVI